MMTISSTCLRKESWQSVVQGEWITLNYDVLREDVSMQNEKSEKTTYHIVLYMCVDVHVYVKYLLRIDEFGKGVHQKVNSGYLQVMGL